MSKGRVLSPYLQACRSLLYGRGSTGQKIPSASSSRVFASNLATQGYAIVYHLHSCLRTSTKCEQICKYVIFASNFIIYCGVNWGSNFHCICHFQVIITGWGRLEGGGCNRSEQPVIRVHIFKGQPELATCNQIVNQQYALSNGFAIVYQQAISST